MLSLCTDSYRRKSLSSLYLAFSMCKTYPLDPFLAVLQQARVVGPPSSASVARKDRLKPLLTIRNNPRANVEDTDLIHLASAI